MSRQARDVRRRSSFLLQDVPNTAHGLQQTAPSALLELLANIADVDVHHVATRAEIKAPDGVEQLLPAEHLPGIAHEVLEQVEFLGGCRDQLIAAPHLARR